MDPKLKYFVFDRKEFTILSLIVLVVGVLAFTTGLHFGKQYAIAPAETQEPFAEPVALKPQVEKLPHDRDLDFGAHDAARKAEVSIDKSLQQEVTNTGLQLTKHIPTVLPVAAKSKTIHGPAKAPDLSKNNQEIARAELQGITQDAINRVLPAGKYTLQIAKFEKVDETRSSLRAMESIGLKPVLRVSQLKGKFTSFRLLHGGFPTTTAAEDAGKLLLSQGKIDSFVVVNRPAEDEE
ncbi:MAG: hypothetical protein KA715_13365 [Xanthomonadaceae bacterium]|nr:hypothetical protein [Xanthomonadaceae bacterium]